MIAGLWSIWNRTDYLTTGNLHSDQTRVLTITLLNWRISLTLMSTWIGMAGSCISWSYQGIWQCLAITVTGNRCCYVQSFLEDKKKSGSALATSALMLMFKKKEFLRNLSLHQHFHLYVCLFHLPMFVKIATNIYMLVYADDITILTFHGYKSLARKRIQTAVNTVSEWAHEQCRNGRKLSKLPGIPIKNILIKSQEHLKILLVYLNRTLALNATLMLLVKPPKIGSSLSKSSEPDFLALIEP